MELEKEKEQRLQKEMEHEDEAKQHAMALQQQHVLKAKEHNMKVNDTVEQHKEKRAKELQAMRADSDNKLQQADKRREHVLEKKIETAIEVGQKHRSDSKGNAPHAQ